MNLGLIAVKSIVKLFLMFGVGVIAALTGIIDESGSKSMARLVNKVTNPIKIFSSYLIAYDAVKFRGLITAAQLGALCLTISIIAGILFIKKKGETWRVERLVVTLPNCGYMGIPLISAMLGDEAVFYLTGLILVFNLVAWTYGITLMSGRNRLKDLLKVLVSPTIIAIAAGICFYLMEIPMPELVGSTIKTIGDCTTPLVMMVAGSTIARTNFIKILGKKSTWLTVFLRLLFCPIAFSLICCLIDAPDLVMQTICIAAACPCASVVVTQALAENRTPGHASGIFAISTILCAATMPFTIWLHGLLH